MIKELFELDERIQTITDEGFDPETGEVLDADSMKEALEQAFADRRDMLINIGIYNKRHSANIEAAKKEKARIEDYIRSEQKKVEWSKGFLDQMLAGQKLVEPGKVSVTFRTTKNGKAVIDNDAIVPEMYCKMIREVSKSAVKEALLNGDTVPGAHLEDSRSVIIK